MILGNSKIHTFDLQLPPGKGRGCEALLCSGFAAKGAQKSPKWSTKSHLLQQVSCMTFDFNDASGHDFLRSTSAKNFQMQSIESVSFKIYEFNNLRTRTRCGIPLVECTRYLIYLKYSEKCFASLICICEFIAIHNT